MSQLGLSSRKHRDWLLERMAPDKRNSDRVRRAALIALAEIGPASDMKALLRSYATWAPDDPAIEFTATLLSELPTEASADWLIQCSANGDLPDATRLRCLHGLTLLDDDYDGDSGSATQAAHWIDADGLPDHFQPTACAVLREMYDRGGLTAREHWNRKKHRCESLGVASDGERPDALDRLAYLLARELVKGDFPLDGAPFKFDSPAAGPQAPPVRPQTTSGRRAALETIDPARQPRGSQSRDSKASLR